MPARVGICDKAMNELGKSVRRGRLVGYSGYGSRGSGKAAIGCSAAELGYQTGVLDFGEQRREGMKILYLVSWQAWPID